MAAEDTYSLIHSYSLIQLIGKRKHVGQPDLSWSDITCDRKSAGSANASQNSLSKYGNTHTPPGKHTHTRAFANQQVMLDSDKYLLQREKWQKHTTGAGAILLY